MKHPPLEYALTADGPWCTVPQPARQLADRVAYAYQQSPEETARNLTKLMNGEHIELPCACGLAHRFRFRP